MQLYQKDINDVTKKSFPTCSLILNAERYSFGCYEKINKAFYYPS